MSTLASFSKSAINTIQGLSLDLYDLSKSPFKASVRTIGFFPDGRSKFPYKAVANFDGLVFYDFLSFEKLFNEAVLNAIDLTVLCSRYISLTPFSVLTV